MPVREAESWTFVAEIQEARGGGADVEAPEDLARAAVEKISLGEGL